MQLLLRHLVVYEITNTAASLAWMTVAAVVVLPFMAPIAGVYVDRLNKRTILLFTEVSSTLLFLGIGILIGIRNRNRNRNIGIGIGRGVGNKSGNRNRNRN